MRNRARNLAVGVAVLLVVASAAWATTPSMAVVRLIKQFDGNTERARAARSLFRLSAAQAEMQVLCWAADIDDTLFVILQAPHFGVVDADTLRGFLERLMGAPGELFQAMGFKDAVFVLMATPYDPPRAVGSMASREITIRR